ncbi:hypothetical protein FA950_28120 [Bacillus thuringiensis]|uniref:hypothetical protein n=1 Tax=Bacillus thuringiensis TaxID=1428 RepID=UPI0010AB5974|nr:hypothetical protein [Bacillus thuringiensis]TKA00363.1 hypothetical protein FA950_28120 [Bacillus thuringiensis]
MSHSSFQPIISKSNRNTLHDKEVEIKGTNDFGRNNVSSNKKEIEPIINKVKTPVVEKIDSRLVPSKTAKISPAVLLKLNTLKPFIKERESMDKTSINSIIDMLIESYIHTKLSPRQSDGYKGMYKHLYEMLHKK